MRKRHISHPIQTGLVLFIFFLLPVQCILAQDIENALLWKVEGKDIKPSYLFGTIHLLPQSEFELKDKVLQSMQACEVLAMELDFSNQNMQMEMMQHMAMTDGTTLDKLLNDEDLKKLDVMLTEQIGVGVQMVLSFKPFMVGTMLIGRYIEGTPASFEMTLTQHALSQNMQIKGLETVTEQMMVFERISYQEQANDLAKMLNDEERYIAMYKDMVKLYRGEMVNKLYEVIRSEFEEHEEQLLLADRNQKWIPRIKDTAANQSVFFAVGAGHLPGKDGVVNLLRNAGYTLTPVN